MPRLLLLLPTYSWRAEALLTAAQRLGLDVTVATDRPLVWTTHAPARVVALDFAHPEAAAEAIDAYARALPFHAVVGADDDTALAAAAIAQRLGLPHNPIAALEAARDKLRQREVMHRAGIPVPGFTLCRLDEDPARIAARVVLPCVVKPRRLAASRGVMRADDVSGLGAALRRLRIMFASPEVGACGEWADTALVEEFVPGREVALEGMLENGRLRILALFDKPDPLDGPYFEETIYVTPSRLPSGAQEQLSACAERAALALGLVRGPVHAELRVNERGPWIVELAARPIGGLCSRVLRFEDGSSLEELILREALGLDTAGVTREARSAGVMMIPIPGPGVLERVEGRDEAAAVPDIDQVVITAHPGERLVPFPEGSRYPGFLFASGADPAAVEKALRSAHAHLRFVLTPATRPAGRDAVAQAATAPPP
jgi:biotin carboxylase